MKKKELEEIAFALENLKGVLIETVDKLWMKIGEEEDEVLEEHKSKSVYTTGYEKEEVLDVLHPERYPKNYKNLEEKQCSHNSLYFFHKGDPIIGPLLSSALYMGDWVDIADNTALKNFSICSSCGGNVKEWEEREVKTPEDDKSCNHNSFFYFGKGDTVIQPYVSSGLYMDGWIDSDNKVVESFKLCSICGEVKLWEAMARELDLKLSPSKKQKPLENCTGEKDHDFIYYSKNRLVSKEEYKPMMRAREFIDNNYNVMKDFKVCKTCGIVKEYDFSIEQ